MKKSIAILILFFGFSGFAQQHFSGINTSSRTGIINGGINPAEFANIRSKYEINIIAPSVVASSNKVGFNDLVGGEDLGDKIFEGSENANFKIDGEIVGPGIVYKYEQWAFAFSTRAHARIDIVEVDTNIGDAIANAGLNSILGSTTISNDANQRLNGTTWGEIGLSAARNFLDDEEHSFGAGITLKILFPGSYANFGADRFTGTINNNLGVATMTDTQANLNIAYSGNLGDDFTDAGDYFSSMFGKLNGLAADIGVNYRMKDNSGNGGYRLNAGLSVRNIGSMTFKSSNNSSTNYLLSIQGTDALNLNQFENVTSLKEIEEILLQSGFLSRTDNNRTDFKVALPTLLIAYADVRVIPDFFVTGYLQQKMKKDEENDQIANENVVSLTPRYLFGSLEAFVPLSINEISGFSAGAGFRAYGFFVGSSSLFTALINNSNQADVYIGYGFSL